MKTFAPASYRPPRGRKSTTASRPVDRAAPFEQIRRDIPDAQGELSLQLPIPPTAPGVSFWTQALKIHTLNAGNWSNSLALTVQ